MRAPKKSLSLEILEARALFAGVGVSDLYDKQLEVMKAIDADGQHGMFLSRLDNVGNDTLILTAGSGSKNLTIDFDKLPAYVINVQVSGFDTVNFDGQDHVQNLTVTDVRLLHAPQIDVTTRLEATRVAELELKSIGGFDSSVTGTDVKMHVDDFGPFTVVHLDLQTALIDTKSEDLGLDVLREGTLVALPNTPDQLKTLGLDRLPTVANSESAVYISPSLSASSKSADKSLAIFPEELFSEVMERVSALRSANQSIDLATIRAVIADVAVPHILPALSATSHVEASFKEGLRIEQLVLVGDGTGSLDVDFDKLPAYITTLSVSKFDTVVFSGADHLQNIVASDIHSLHAPQIDVTGQLISTRVDDIELKSIGGSGAFIQGEHVKLNVGDIGPLATVILRVDTAIVDTPSQTLRLDVWNEWTVVALPQVPKFLTGVDQIDTRLRLASSDVSAPASVETPVTTPDPEQTTTTYISDQVAAATLQRLAALRSASESIDISLIKRIVAELTTPQQPQAVTPTLLGAGAIPEYLLRRDNQPTLIEHGGAYQFTAPAPTEVPAPVDALPVGTPPVEKIKLPAVIDNSLTEAAPAPVDALPHSQDDAEGAADLHVSVNPESVPTVVKASLFGMISQLLERGMNLKSYVLDQISQEVSPGERSSVLLVDPKPTTRGSQPRINS